MEAWLGRPALAPPQPRALAVASALQEGASLQADPIIESQPTDYSATPYFAIPRGRSWFAGHWRLALVIAMALAVVFAVKQRVIQIDALRKGVSQLVGLPSAAPPRSAQVASFRERAAALDSQMAEPSPLTPTSYGIYAVSGDKLFDLEQLLGRAPDLRIAVSPAIVRPSRTTLPDGHLKFIVYRRDSATSAVDRAEVRVIAKVAEEMNFDKSGKSTRPKSMTPGSCGTSQFRTGQHRKATIRTCMKS
jgi:hypothetical protein